MEARSQLRHRPTPGPAQRLAWNAVRAPAKKRRVGCLKLCHLTNTVPTASARDLSHRVFVGWVKSTMNSSGTHFACLRPDQGLQPVARATAFQAVISYTYKLFSHPNDADEPRICRMLANFQSLPAHHGQSLHRNVTKQAPFHTCRKICSPHPQDRSRFCKKGRCPWHLPFFPLNLQPA